MYALAIIFGVLINLIIPAVIIVALYRFFTRNHRESNGEPKPLTDRDITLGVLAVTTSVTLLPALFLIPTSLLNLESEGAIFAIRVATGVLLLLGGLPVGHFAGKFLMLTGLALVGISLPYVFNNFGNAGAFVVILAAFAAVIAAVVRLHKNSERHETN